VVRAMVGASSPASLLTPEERPAEHSHAAASLGGREEERRAEHSHAAASLGGREEERRAERAPGCDVAAMARVGGLWSHGASAVVPRKDVSAASSGVISAVSSGVISTVSSGVISGVSSGVISAVSSDVSSDGPSDEPEPAGIEGPRPTGVLGTALGTALDLRLSDNAFTRSAI
jgi:hypothetical protein